MSKVNKDMTIADVLRIDKMGIAPILMTKGLHCLSCPVASQETLEEACEVHGIDLNGLISDVNEYLSEREQ